MVLPSSSHIQPHLLFLPPAPDDSAMLNVTGRESGGLPPASPWGQREARGKIFFFYGRDPAIKKETSAFTGGRSTNHIINNTKTNNQ